VLLMPLAGRAAICVHLALLPPARPDGLGAIFCRQRHVAAAIGAVALLAVAAAVLLGPMRGLVLAAACLALLATLVHFPRAPAGPGQKAVEFIIQMILLNVILAAFNALPIPPLDGSRVADWLMPEVLRPAWQGLCRLGPFALMAVIFLPRAAGVSLFEWPIKGTFYLIQQVMTLAGG